MGKLNDLGELYKLSLLGGDMRGRKKWANFGVEWIANRGAI